MNIKSKVEGFLNVNHGEWTSLGLFFVLFFLSAFGGCIGLNVCESIFIQRYGGIERIPLVYLVTFSVIIFITFFFNFLRSKFSLKNYALITFISIISLLVANFTSLTALPDSRIQAAFLFILAYMSFFITKTLLFDIAEDVYDLRQIKRLFSTFSSGMILGFAAGGILTGKILDLVGRKENLIPVWVIFLGLSLLLGLYILRNLSSQGSTDGEENDKKGIARMILENFKNLSKSRLFLYLAILSFLTAFLVMFFDYLYFFLVNDIYQGRSEEMTKVFGAIRGYSTLITFVLQFFFTSLLIRFFGLTNILQIFPMAFLSCFALIIHSFSLLRIYIGRFGYYIAKEAFHFPSFQPLFNALSNRIKQNAAPFIYNVVAGIGSITATIYLMFFINLKAVPRKQLDVIDVTDATAYLHEVRFDMGNASWVAISLSLFFIITAWLAKKAYVRELLNNIKETSPKQLDMLEAVKKLNDSDAINQMKLILQGEDKNLILFVIESIKSLNTTEADSEIAGLIHRFDDTLIADKVFNYFDDRYYPEMVQSVDKILLMDNVDIKILFLCYIGQFKDSKEKDIHSKINQYIHSFFYDENTDVKTRAAGLLYDSSVDKYRTSALEYIEKEFASTSPKDLLRLIDNISTTRAENFARMALEQNVKFFTKDVPIQLKHQYIEVLAKFNFKPSLVFIINNAMGDKTFRRHLEEIILGISETRGQELSSLITKLVRSERDRESREYLTSILLMIAWRDSDSESILLDYIFSEDGNESLKFRIAEQVPNFSSTVTEERSELLSRVILEQIEKITDDLLSGEFFQGKYDLLSDIYTEEMKRMSRKRTNFILNLMRYQYSEHQIAIAINGLKSSDNKLRNSSIETIENIIPRKIAEPFILLVDRDMAKIKEKNNSILQSYDLDRIISKLISADSSWMNCLAVHIADKLQIKGAKESIASKKSQIPLFLELREAYLSAS